MDVWSRCIVGRRIAKRDSADIFRRSFERKISRSKFDKLDAVASIEPKFRTHCKRYRNSTFTAECRRGHQIFLLVDIVALL
jgi:hypothetical protein